MSDFTLGPLPCRNSESFSKISRPKEFFQNYSQRKTTMVVHRHVEGENNGKCYKIKGPKTPFILRHLEKTFMLTRELSEEPEVRRRPAESQAPAEPVVRATKREHSLSSDEEDANQPSTSAAAAGSASKKQRFRM